MTAVAPRSTTLIGPRRKLLSPLETLLQHERRDLVDILGRVVMRTCRIRLQDAEDVVGTALVTAISREREGKGWDPGGELTVEQYMFFRVFDAVRDSRRTARRKPATPCGDASDIASAAPDGSVAEAEDEIEELRKLAADLRRHFEEETGGRIPLGIMDQHLRGVDGHENIAKELKCTVPEVRAGWGRLKYQGKRMAAAARGRKDRS
jgi:hypothetical protein